MLTIKIKICGITNPQDALAAVDMGADMLGFNFYPKSKRYISQEKALAIIDMIPTFVDTVGVFVNAPACEIRDVTEKGFLNWVQLHGDETPEFCDSLRHLSTRIIKAIRIKTADDVKRAEDFYTDSILFDAFDGDHYGGTGRTFDWSIIDHLYKRIFLAGGITPENVGQALNIGVYGIDICSGIESEPGKKDHPKMKLLFDNIHKVRG